ncbi:hypothetical protein NFI96_011945, partial [Prochilodus magdalenae]
EPPSVLQSSGKKMEKATDSTLCREHPLTDPEILVSLFTETWLITLTPDTLVSLDGFHLIRADRTAESVWEELSDPNEEDIDSLTHCITDYVDFCVENTVPTKTIQCFSNNKPWINPDIKALLKEKKRAFRSGDKDELKAVQRELRRKIREGKASYRRKLEEQLQRNNVSGVWKGLKTISGHKKPDSQVVGDQNAFNTIQPGLLKDKLEHVGVESHLSNWILDYLTNQPHYVRARDCVSDKVVSSTGAPQGTVLAPFLFTLYTADFMYSSPNCHLQKFSDDSAIVGLITNEEDSEYRELIQDFVDWCLQNHLQINVGKTKELVVDFRRCRHPPQLVNIRGTDIERVDSYKYLGVHLNNKLDWSVNTTALHKKGQSRLYLLRRLRSLGVQGALLRTFFDTVVASAIFYGVVCWGSSISLADRKRLDKLLKRAGSVLGSPLDPVQVVGDRRMLVKLASMLENDSHSMHETLAALGSSFSDRLLHPKYVKEQYRSPYANLSDTDDC